MKDYYSILQVTRSASTSEIRRAYRVLVQQLHPDINPNPAAHELIKEVNEAYDVLGDAVKKAEYDYRLDNPFVIETTPQPPPHRDPRYRRRSGYQPPPSGRPTQRDLMQKYVHLALYTAYAGCLLCLVLLVDYSLPHQVTRDTVEAFEAIGSGRAKGYYLITHGDRSLKISDRDADHIELEQSIELVESRLLGELITITIEGTDFQITNLGSVYRNFKFVLWMLFVFSVLGAIRKGEVEFRFNLGIINFFVLIFTVILLLR